jgi:nickel/cobalt transporter (NicO) family protein
MFSAGMMQAFRDSQRIFHELLFSDLATLRQEPSLIAYASLIMAGFIYGVVHAIGPGHGKVIVSSYVLANENSLKRGLWVVGLSSLLQALTAIAVVLGFYYLLAVTRAEAESLAGLLEIISFSLIGIIGLLLVAKGLRDLVRAFLPARHHGHHHPHNHDCGCDHAHVPPPKTLEQSKGIAELATMIISIGIRPCSGALLLLFFACMVDLILPGVLAVLAMAVGTALSTGALAIIAVKSRQLALRLVESSAKRLVVLQAGLRLLGGTVLVLMAAFFLTAQISGDTPSPNTATHPLYKSLK